MLWILISTKEGRGTKYGNGTSSLLWNVGTRQSNFWLEDWINVGQSVKTFQAWTHTSGDWNKCPGWRPEAINQDLLGHSILKIWRPSSLHPHLIGGTATENSAASRPLFSNELVESLEESELASYLSYFSLTVLSECQTTESGNQVSRLTSEGSLAWEKYVPNICFQFIRCAILTADWLHFLFALMPNVYFSKCSS